MFRKMTLTFLLILAGAFTILAVVRLEAGVDEDREEAGLLIGDISADWSNHQYQDAKDKIDAKLAARPNWLPAVILNSAYYTYIQIDNSSALTSLSGISSTIASLDSEEYGLFLTSYNLYVAALYSENTGALSQQEKNAKLELHHRLFTYFPGAELVARYFQCAGGG